VDDGRYNKVANVVGHTMQYHPHGDASISDAMVQIGQKELLIDCQGNWEISLLVIAQLLLVTLKHVCLNLPWKYSPKITDWEMSYDGRRAENQ
jgi:topoisomerase-4 subunit A